MNFNNVKPPYWRPNYTIYEPYFRMSINPKDGTLVFDNSDSRVSVETQNDEDKPSKGFKVGIIKDSISPDGVRLTTMHLRYPRMVHGELMTHRVFCLAGDARLDFELPAKFSTGARRVHSMSLREFADKWHNGAIEGASSRHNGRALDHLDATRIYSAAEIAKELGMRGASNLNALCRDGAIFGARKRGREWVAYGRYWMEWRSATGTRRFDLKDRLSKMRIRQLDERTGEVVTSTIKDCIVSGTKEIFRVSAGNFSVCGSKDHRILTVSGWKRIEEIVPGVDQVMTYRYGSGANTNPNRFNKIDGRWVQTWTRQNRQFVADRQHGLCAVSGEPLETGFHLHHKKPRHERPDLAFDLDNVIAVNPKVHDSLHENQGWQIGVPLGSQATTVDAVTSEGLCDTYDLEIVGEFPNFFADGVVVHNSRNARSSRAVPTKRLSEEDIYIPNFRRNVRGMQPGEYLTEEDQAIANNLWELAANECQRVASMLATSKLSVHKQWTNRMLEWFGWIDTLVTATDWDNFEALRTHEDAQEEIRILAKMVKLAREEHTPSVLKPGVWHLPYIMTDYHSDGTVTYSREMSSKIFYSETLSLDCARKVSAARCAAVSYKPFDGDASLEREMERFEMLYNADPMHASPFEHQATPDQRTSWLKRKLSSGYHVWRNQHEHGNLYGWRQWRKMLPGEAVFDWHYGG